MPRSIAVTVIAAAIVLISAGSAYASVSLVWARQFGTSNLDRAFAVTRDSTAIYVAGSTAPNDTSDGTTTWIKRYSSSGRLFWTVSFSMIGYPTGIAVGGGLVYVTGIDEGVSCEFSENEAFLSAVTTSGSLQWLVPYSQCPTNAIVFRGVAADDTGAFVVGGTDGALPGHVNKGGSDAVLLRFDPNGHVMWTRQFGTTQIDAATSVATAGGNDVFVGGTTAGVLPGQTGSGQVDAFIRGYTTSGARLWTSQFGAPDGQTQLRQVEKNTSGLAVAGWSGGTLPGQTYAGGRDAYVREYSLDGSVLWTREFGTSGSDVVEGVSGHQTIWVAGNTDGSFPGAGAGDVFVRRLDPFGNTIDTTQFGTGAEDNVRGMTASDTSGYIAGDTDGRWPGQTRFGRVDAYLVRVSG